MVAVVTSYICQHCQSLRQTPLNCRKIHWKRIKCSNLVPVEFGFIRARMPRNCLFLLNCLLFIAIELTEGDFVFGKIAAFLSDSCRKRCYWKTRRANEKTNFEEHFLISVLIYSFAASGRGVRTPLSWSKWKGFDHNPLMFIFTRLQVGAECSLLCLRPHFSVTFLQTKNVLSKRVVILHHKWQDKECAPRLLAAFKFPIFLSGANRDLVKLSFSFDFQFILGALKSMIKIFQISRKYLEIFGNEYYRGREVSDFLGLMLHPVWTKKKTFFWSSLFHLIKLWFITFTRFIN